MPNRKVRREPVALSTREPDASNTVRCFDARRACRITDGLQKLHIVRIGPRG